MDGEREISILIEIETDLHAVTSGPSPINLVRDGEAEKENVNVWGEFIIFLLLIVFFWFGSDVGFEVLLICFLFIWGFVQEVKSMKLKILKLVGGTKAFLTNKNFERIFRNKKIFNSI